jgi:predicted PurR-regulated permease PerM
VTEESPGAQERSARSIAVLAAVAAIALGLWVLGAVVHVLLLVFAGALLGLFLHGAGAWLARKSGLPTPAMVGTFCFVLVGLVAVIAWLAAPSVATQVDELTTALPRAFEAATAPIERHAWGRSLLERARQFDDVLARRETWSRAGGLLFSTLGSAGSLFVLVFIGLFTAFDPDSYRNGMLRMLPRSRRARAREISSMIAHTLQLWMVGKLVSMTVVGVSTWVGLTLLEIPLALVLALLAAVLTFIPNFGPVLSAVPAILLALLQGPMTAASVAGLYVAIQTVESYVLTPLLQKKIIALPPALAIAAQVVMGTLAGGLGLVVATPLTAGALVLVKEAYVRDRLGED